MKQNFIQLNGKKCLVNGNHDVYSNEYCRKEGFAEVYDMSVLYKEFWIMSYEAIYVNSNMPYANLFGHVYNSPIVKNYSSHIFVYLSRDKLCSYLSEKHVFSRNRIKNNLRRIVKNDTSFLAYKRINISQKIALFFGLTVMLFYATIQLYGKLLNFLY